MGWINLPRRPRHVGQRAGHPLIGKSAGEGLVRAGPSRPLVFSGIGALRRVEETGGRLPGEGPLLRGRSTRPAEIVRSGQTLTLEKEKGKDAWKQITPAPKAADTAKIDALLTALTSTRATSFVDTIAGTGLDSPELTVSIAYEDGQKHEKVAFARKGADVFARREGDAAAAKIDATALDGIVKALDGLR